MDTITVTMTEYAFSPTLVILKGGVPTKLVLKNAGKVAHYFVAETFFKTIATSVITSYSIHYTKLYEFSTTP